MGEIADSMINGDFDFFTGEYIGRGHGYPRTKNKSLPWEKRKKHKNYGNDPRKGVLNYIQRQYSGIQHAPKAIKIAKHFFCFMGAEFESENKMFELISQNFGLFVKWFRDNKNEMKRLYSK